MLVRSRKKRIKGSTDACDIFKAVMKAETLEDKAKEHFWACYLDVKHHILRLELVTLGLANQSLVHSREVFRPAVALSASAVLVCHNHPSGDPTPSIEDINTTRMLKQAGDLLGIQLLDHVIVGDDDHSPSSISLREWLQDSLDHDVIW